MARRTKEDSEKTRKQLLDAAEKLFVANGVGSTSLDDIARAAGVTRGALYWHFDNKFALFDAMHARVKSPLDALLEEAVNDADSFAALQELCVYVLRKIARDMHMRRVFTIVLLKCEESEMQCGAFECLEKKRADVNERFKKVFAQARKDGKIAAHYSPQSIATALQAYMHGLFIEYLRNPKSYNIAALAPDMIGVFFKGLAPLPTKK